MSAGLVPIDIAISAPASGQYTSGLDQSLSLSYNPAFLVGSGTLSSYPGASPSSSASGSQNPSDYTPSSATASPPAGAGLSTLNTALPTSAIAQQSAASSSLIVWLLIGGALILALGGHR